MSSEATGPVGHKGQDRVNPYLSGISIKRSDMVENSEQFSEIKEIRDWSSNPSPIIEFITPKIDVNPKNRLMKLTIGSDNRNFRPGIVFRLPDGQFTDESVNVTVSSVKVTDVTDPDNPKELPGVGSEIVGKALPDVFSGIVVNLPISNNGKDIKYKINIKLETSKGDIDTIAPLPSTASCKVRMILASVKGASLNEGLFKPADQPAKSKVDSKVTTKINKFLSLTNDIDDVLSRNPIMGAGITYNGELFGMTCHISSIISSIIPTKKK